MCDEIVDSSTNQSVFTFLSEFCTHSSGQTAVEVTFLALILVLGITGNSMVLVAVFRNVKIRTVTNILICNLAMTDMLFATGIPFVITTRITKQWILGEFVCKSVTFIQFVSGVCSIVTMAMISVERYMTVCLKNRYKITTGNIRIIIIVIWVIACAFPVPAVLAQTTQIIETPTGQLQYCGAKWRSGFRADIYLGFMACFFFIIPLVLISVLNVTILRVVRASLFRNKVAHTSKKSARKHLRLVKMLASVVLLFVLMWLPFFVISFLAVQYQQITSTHFTVTLILASANTCQNPVVYGYFNSGFREEFRSMCVCC